MKALILAARYPWPPLRGDQMRARDFAVGLRALGARVEVLCSQGLDQGLDAVVADREASLKSGTDRNQGGMAGAARRSAEQRQASQPESSVVVEVLPARLNDRVAGGLAWLGGAPLQALPFRSRALEKAVVGRLQKLRGEDLVVVQLARQLGLLETVVQALASRNLAERPRVVVDLIDTLSLNFQQRAKLDAFWLRGFWRWEAARLRSAEKKAVGLADAVCLVCQRDLDKLVQFAPRARDKAMVVPVSVELLDGEMAPQGAMAISALTVGSTEGSTGSTEEVPETVTVSDLVALTGNLGYFVNHLAVLWFVGEVWPLIKSRRPGARLVVAGARPSGKLRAVVREAVDVRLLADPPDLRGILRQATVAVAPLSGGAGVPVKVLEGWAEGVPMVVSEWAAEGVAAPRHEESARGGVRMALSKALVSLPSDADQGEWAQAVVDLLKDGSRRTAMREEGRRRVAELHGREAFLSALAVFAAPKGETAQDSVEEPLVLDLASRT